MRISIIKPIDLLITQTELFATNICLKANEQDVLISSKYDRSWSNTSLGMLGRSGFTLFALAWPTCAYQAKEDDWSIFLWIFSLKSGTTCKKKLE